MASPAVDEFYQARAPGAVQALEVTGAMYSCDLEFVALQEVNPLAQDIYANVVSINQ